MLIRMQPLSTKAMAYLIFLIALGGLIGGVINALLSDNGFVMPKPQEVDGKIIYRPGFIGNMLIGAISSFVSWAFYGPMANVFIAGSPAALKSNRTDVTGITLSALGGAVLIGIAGSRWLTNEVDKTILRNASVIAARSQAQNSIEEATATRIADSMSLSNSPAQLLRLAQELPKSGVGNG